MLIQLSTKSCGEEDLQDKNIPIYLRTASQSFFTRRIIRCVFSATIAEVTDEGGVGRSFLTLAAAVRASEISSTTLAVLLLGVGGAESIIDTDGIAGASPILPSPAGISRLLVSTTLASTMSSKFVTIMPASFLVRPNNDCFVKRTIGMWRKPRSTIYVHEGGEYYDS